MVRTPVFDKNGMKKGAWSPEEDDKLRSYIQRYGHWNWRELPKYAGLSRCGKSCRLRWLNYLCPNVKRGNYSEEEVNIIFELREKLGNKWSAIAAKLPGRTDNEIKNFWHTHLSKRQKREQATSQVPRNEAIRTSQPQRNPIDQCTGASQFEANDQRNSTELSPENVGVAPPAQPILESSRTSPEPRGSEIFLCDSNPEDHANSCSELLAEPVGNFWTEPFLADSTCDQDQYSGFMSPYCSQYGDDNDLIYEKLPDFPNY